MYGSLAKNENILFATPKERTVSWFQTGVVSFFPALVIMVATFSLGFALLSSDSTDVEVVEDLKGDYSFSWSLNRSGYDSLDYFTSNSTFLSYKILENMCAVVEPSAEMLLSIENFDPSSDNTYTLDICRKDICYSGSVYLDEGKIVHDSVVVPCVPPEVLSVTVKRLSTLGRVLSNFTGSGICTYVRREIRDLTEEDLSATMDAMYALWTTSDEDGQQKYGEDFHNITYLLEMHHFNAAWRDADHFHEGNGFLAQHVKMTNIFESSMQLVNPAVAMPYWDFTIEESTGQHAYDSPIMSDTMFGSMMSPTNSSIGFTYSGFQIEDFAVKDGRWAYTPAEFNPTKFSSLQAGYGYMRSPWNMNPSPYLTRFTGSSFLPSCSSHYSILQYTDLMDFSFDMELGPHAAVHGDLGGAFGCDMFSPLFEAGYINSESDLLTICKVWIFTLKALYRKNLIEPRECDLVGDVQSASCPFQCIYESTDDDDPLSGLKLQLMKLLKGEVPSDISDDGKTAWGDFVCGGNASRVFGGDHAESASPSDPSFWPIHPTLERLLHAKMIAGGFNTSGWDSEADDACIRSSCYENGESDTWEECCYGHFEDSQMLDFVTGSKEKYFGPTNGDTYSSTDPTNSAYSMTYIYDGFSWDHCEEDFGFEDLLTSMYEAQLEIEDSEESEDSTHHKDKSDK